MNRTNIDYIVSALSSGDSSVLDKIYRENRKPFLRFAKKFDLPEEDLIDVYQDAVIAFRDNIVLGKVKFLKSSIRTYLFSIGKFMIYKKINDAVKLKSIQEQLQLEYGTATYHNYDFRKDIYQSAIDKALEELGGRCKEILWLFYYKGLTLKEIQKHFNYSDYNVVKSLKSRCLSQLKNKVLKLKCDEER